MKEYKKNFQHTEKKKRKHMFNSNNDLPLAAVTDINFSRSIVLKFASLQLLKAADSPVKGEQILS